MESYSTHPILNSITRPTHLIKFHFYKDSNDRSDWANSPFINAVDSISVDYGLQSQNILVRGPTDKFNIDRNTLMGLNQAQVGIVAGNWRAEGYDPNVAVNPHEDFLSLNFGYRVGSQEYTYSMYRLSVFNQVSYQMPLNAELINHEILPLHPPSTPDRCENFETCHYYEGDGKDLPSSIKIMTELDVNISKVALSFLNDVGQRQTLNTFAFKTTGHTHYRGGYTVPHSSSLRIAPMWAAPFDSELEELDR